MLPFVKHEDNFDPLVLQQTKSPQNDRRRQIRK